MKKNSAISLACAVLFFLTGADAHAGEGMKLKALLVLGSNEPQPKGRAVSTAIEGKLKHLPLKWAHYYVVNSMQFSVAKDETQEIILSGECQISVKNLGEERVEMTLKGNGQNVGKITQSLHKGQTLVTGGNTENTIVVLRQPD